MRSGGTADVSYAVSSNDMGLVRAFAQSGRYLALVVRGPILVPEDSLMIPVLPLLVGADLPVWLLTPTAGSRSVKIRAVVSQIREALGAILG